MVGPPNQKEQARHDFGPPGVLAVFMVWGWLAVGPVLVGQEIKTAHLGGNFYSVGPSSYSPVNTVDRYHSTPAK